MFCCLPQLQFKMGVANTANIRQMACFWATATSPCDAYEEPHSSRILCYCGGHVPLDYFIPYLAYLQPVQRVTLAEMLIAHPLCVAPQVLQQAMTEHIQRACTAFEGNTPAHTALVATLAALSADPELPVAEIAGMAAMKVLSGGLPPELLADLAQQVEQAEDKLDAVASLLSVLSD
jgi:hypothetical protein